MFAFDTAAFSSINGLAGSSAALDAFGIFCAEWLIFVMAAVGLARVLYLVKKRDPISPAAVAGAERAIVASATASVANLAFAAFVWFRARPYVDLAFAHRLIAEPGTPQSFPSGHSTVAFAIAFTSLFVDPRCGRWLLLAAVFVAIGRVYVGVHYPMDVVVGAGVGFLWAYAARLIGEKAGDVRRFAGMLARN